MKDYRLPIEIHDLTVSYQKRPVLYGVDLEIEEGSLVGVLGPNGAGKSTLLKGVIGTLVPMEGNLTLGSISRENIAYLPQQSDIDRSFPIAVIDLVAMGLWREIGPFGWLSTAQQSLVEKAIAAVGLSGFESRIIGSLSGGQMQRVLFARLLLQDAQLVLLDEPFSNLDVLTKSSLRKEIRKIAKLLALSVMFVTHDIYDAIDIADEIIFLDDGRILQKCDTALLMDQNVDEITKYLKHIQEQAKHLLSLKR